MIVIVLSEGLRFFMLYDEWFLPRRFRSQIPTIFFSIFLILPNNTPHKRKIIPIPLAESTLLPDILDRRSTSTSF